MGQTSVYYVPKNQASWRGRKAALADQLWALGIVVDTETILERARMYKVEGRSLPDCDLDLMCEGLGVVDEDPHPVPNWQYDVTCPKCGGNMLDQFHEIMSRDSEKVCAEREAQCPQCRACTRLDALSYGDPMTFAGFYVQVSDCEPDNWDARFRPTLEGIVGPCDEFWEWST